MVGLQFLSFPESFPLERPSSAVGLLAHTAISLSTRWVYFNSIQIFEEACWSWLESKLNVCRQLLVALLGTALVSILFQTTSTRPGLYLFFSALQVISCFVNMVITFFARLFWLSTNFTPGSNLCSAGIWGTTSPMSTTTTPHHGDTGNRITCHIGDTDHKIIVTCHIASGSLARVPC